MKRARWVLPLLVLVTVTAGCTHTASTVDPRRVVAAPPTTLRPALPAWGLERTPLGRDGAADVETIRFRIYDDVLGRYRELSGELWLPHDASAHPRPVPLIVTSPILGGAYTHYLECKVLAAAAAKRGMAAFYLHQDEILLAPALGGTELERLLRSDVQTYIQALDLLLAEPELDAARVGAFGISLGGIRVTLLAAAEPRIRAVVVAIAGAGYADIIGGSRENLVQHYLERRQELTGLDRAVILDDVRANIRSDPLYAADSVDSRRLLMFLARFDRHVPIATGRRLHEILGGPELRVAPLGHYSSILVIPWCLHHTSAFFRRELGVTP